MAGSLINPFQCVKDVAKCIFTEALWPPVKCHIDYWWCFDGNVQGLRNEIGGLEREMSNMVQKIEEARLRAEIATTDVKNWLNEGTQKLEEATGILQGCVDLKARHIKARYLVGKSAIEIAEGIVKLRNEGNSIRISDPAPPTALVPITQAPTLEFQSRKRIEEDIMKYLKDGNVRMIAICGAGGVGKTTVAERIEDRVRKEMLFDEVVTVVVSRPTDELKIQKQIAQKLGLGLSEDNLGGRLHTRLMDSKKKLIIFDDVWESFKLKDIGVPYGGCEIILTSRAKDVCEEMEANKIIEIQVLDEEEAWKLFREKSGDCVEDSDLRPTAKDVAAECKGLPIALVTVGKALQKKNINTWKDALSQMRKANPIDFPQFLKNVYMPLKLSYDFLETEGEKSLFLLCCLFPEDCNIPIEDLALLSFGLGMFEGINNIEEGRDRTHNLLGRLRSRFLLMTGENEDEVKMHDVVRDVAIFIGSKEKLSIGFLKSLQVSSKDSSRNCNWMSVEISNIANAKLPLELDFPNLRLLMILNSSNFEFPEGFDVNDICFKGMEELTVLYFSNGRNFQSLPLSLKFLKKLRKLYLERCKVKDISVVGKLTSLEILRVLTCDEIEELPADVGELKFLRLLELWNCRKLERIAAGVISSLVGLEELKIVGCFNKWEVNGNISEERNASLSELESLHNLTSLKIDIFDLNFVAQEMSLSKHLRRYQIRSYNVFDYYDSWAIEKKITLYLPRDVTVGDWIRLLVKNTQSLVLNGDGSNYFNLREIESLKKLVLENCSTLEKIIDGTIPEGSNSFQNLKSIYIQNCPNLRYLFSLATARSLVQLQRLQIVECDKIEQLFFWNEMESNTEASIIEFPKLKTLYLLYLPSLLAFTQLGVEIIKFPQLIELQIINCPKLRTKIHNYPNFMIMIESLSIGRCDTVEEIFRDDGNRHIIFQELSELKLEDLSCLTTFYRGVESIKFPKLKWLRIVNCPRLNSFVAIDSEHTHDLHSLHFFCNKKVEIISLKELHLIKLSDKISQMWCRHIPITFFHNLEKLYIDKVDGIRNLISFSIAKALINLNTLEISQCKEMIDVIEDDGTIPEGSNFSVEEIFRDDGNRHIIFQELYRLNLDNLPYLTTFYGGVESIKFPKLGYLRIGNLARLKSFVAIDSEHTHDLHYLHFFCNKKVEIMCLKELCLYNSPHKISQIWCPHIPISFFHNLEKLYIFEVDGIRNLISSSIAKDLVNLGILYISYCKEMIDVIEDEKHVSVDLVLPKLKYLSITSNYKLRSFCQWKHAFELPSLGNVQINGCPLMKTFTLGSISTPKLREFQINHQDIEIKDLNGGIHHFITTEITNKDDYDEDEKHVYSAEDKDEIESNEKIENINNNFI